MAERATPTPTRLQAQHLASDLRHELLVNRGRHVTERELAMLGAAVANGHFGRAVQEDVARIGSHGPDERNAITTFYAAVAVAMNGRDLDGWRNRDDWAGRPMPAIAAWEMSDGARTLFEARSTHLATVVPEFGRPITVEDLAHGRLGRRMDAAREQMRDREITLGAPTDSRAAGGRPSRLRQNAAIAAGVVFSAGAFGFLAHHTQQTIDTAMWATWVDTHTSVEQVRDLADTKDIRDTIRMAETALETGDFPGNLTREDTEQLRTVAWSALKLNILYSSDPKVIRAISDGDDRSDALAQRLAQDAVKLNLEPGQIVGARTSVTRTDVARDGAGR